MRSRLLLLLALFVIVFQACVEDEGSVTVTYQEAEAIYGDLDDYRVLTFESVARTIEDPGKIFVGDEFILIGEEQDGIHVVDNSDTKSPRLAGFLSIPGTREFFVDGDHIYAESYYDLVKIDISDISNPREVDRVEGGIATPFQDTNGEMLIGFDFTTVTVTITEEDDLYNEIMDDQVVYRDYARTIIPRSALPSSFAGSTSGQIGTANRITKSGDYVYTVSSDVLSVFSDDDGLSKLAAVRDIGEDMETVFPYQDKLFIGARSAMNVVDVSIPSQPRMDYEFEHATSCDPVLPDGDAAYVTLRTADFSACPGDVNQLVVLDIRDLERPREREEITMKSPYAMAIINDRLYIGEGENGLSIFDVSNRLNPRLIERKTDIEAYDIIAHPSNPNVILFTGEDGLNQFKISGDSQFELEGTLNY